MTDNPDDNSETSAIDEAATALATGGYTVNSGGNSPLPGRNVGADLGLNLMPGPQGGLPGGALPQAGLPIAEPGGHAVASFAGEPSFQLAPNAVPLAAVLEREALGKATTSTVP